MLPRTCLALLAAATTILASPLDNVNTVNLTSNALEELKVFVNALGMGVKSRTASTAFYQKVFGIVKGMTMPVASTGQGGWTEDINAFSGEHSSALVIMQWTDTRSTKNLPLKLTLAVQDPKAKVAQVAASGGQALPEMKSESNPEALYAKDPDGYLLEIVGGSAKTSMRSIGVGVSDLQKSADWWAGATGMVKGELKRSAEWDTITLISKLKKASDLVLMDWHETPKRPTKNMPIKLVFKVNQGGQLAASIGKQNPKGLSAGAMAMFKFEPLE